VLFRSRGLIIGGIAAIAVVAVVALTHRTAAPVQAGYANNPGFYNSNNPEPVSRQPEPLDAYGAPANQGYADRYATGSADRYATGSADRYATGSADRYATPSSYSSSSYSRSSHVVYGASPFGADMGMTAVAPPPPPPVETESYRENVTVSPSPEPARVVRRHYVYRHGRRYVVETRRPFSHSAAIVGGSAAGGAAIGAIAGGGKGAAIGALAGGAGGVGYDRLTGEGEGIGEREGGGRAVSLRMGWRERGR